MILDHRLINRQVSYVLIKRLLTAGKPFLLKIIGNSMCPELKPGDYVKVYAPEKNIKNGELVLIEWENHFVVHRLIDSKRGITKGDNLEVCDPQGLAIVGIAEKYI